MVNLISAFGMYRKFKRPFFWPEQYRRTGYLSTAVLVSSGSQFAGLRTDCTGDASTRNRLGQLRALPDDAALASKKLWS
jgi:hypothetical protein